jgi:CRP/FNR family transcriptional regulator, cyclic AMP receptor protein
MGMHSTQKLESTDARQGTELKPQGFFGGLSETSVRAFEQIRFTMAYPEGSVLFREGEEPRGVFVLCQGHAKLSLSSSEGKTLILRLALPGEILGLNAAISGKPYAANAEVLRDCKAYFVRRDDFLRFLSGHADACMKAAQMLSQTYLTACAQIRTLGLSGSALEKLARLLLELSASGEETNQGTRVTLALTHEEISQIIGTSRETVTRTLAQFKTRRLAALHGSTLLIPDKAALQDLAA